MTHKSPPSGIALQKLSPALRDSIISMAWKDSVSFEQIRERTGLREADVIEVMRRELKRSSFRLWRERVRGKISKHRKKAFHRDFMTAEDAEAVHEKSLDESFIKAWRED